MTDEQRFFWLNTDLNRLEEVKWCIENGDAGNVREAIDHLAFMQGSEITDEHPSATAIRRIVETEMP